MSNLTIDQILAECEEEPTIYSEFEKKANSQPSTSNESNLDEVENMVNLLKHASISDELTEQNTEYVVQPRSLQEKVAEAIILNDVIQQTATPETMFKIAALEAGYDEEDIDNLLLEKQAGKIQEANKALKYGLAALGVGGASTGSYMVGKKKGRSRGRKEGFLVGRILQRRADQGMM
jgi:hypothetical protein